MARRIVGEGEVPRWRAFFLPLSLDGPSRPRSHGAGYDFVEWRANQAKRRASPPPGFGWPATFEGDARLVEAWLLQSASAAPHSFTRSESNNLSGRYSPAKRGRSRKIRIHFDLHSPVDEDRHLVADAPVDVRLGRVLEQQARGLIVGVFEPNRVALSTMTIDVRRTESRPPDVVAG